MSNNEFGRKMTCTACAVRFFDLARTPAVCPKCGVEQPRAKPRAAPVARSGAIRWSNRPVPPTLEAVAAAEPTPIETDPLEDVEEEEEEAEDIELADDEDDALKVKHDD